MNEENLDEIIENLKIVYPRYEEESYYDYVVRAMNAIKRVFGYNIAYQKVWKYHEGNHISKSRFIGFETLWICAIARLLYYERISI